MSKFVLGFLVLAAIVGFWGVRSYNKLVSMDQAVQAQWSQVENVYQRRADLVPNLVETASSGPQHCRLRDIASETEIALGARSRINDAMQMSRSVIIARTRPSPSRTGTAPQSQSHISRAATAVESVARTVATCLVIRSRIFMSNLPVSN